MRTRSLAAFLTKRERKAENEAARIATLGSKYWKKSVQVKSKLLPLLKDVTRTTAMIINQTFIVRNTPRPSFCFLLILAFQRMSTGIDNTNQRELPKPTLSMLGCSILSKSEIMSKTTINTVRPTVRGTFGGVHFASQLKYLVFPLKNAQIEEGKRKTH